MLDFMTEPLKFCFDFGLTLLMVHGLIWFILQESDMRKWGVCWRLNYVLVNALLIFVIVIPGSFK